MKGLRYKVGDRVIVNIDANKEYTPVATYEMFKLNGKIVKIDSIIELPPGIKTYMIGNYHYTDDMLLSYDVITEEDVLVLASKVIKKHLGIDRSFEMIKGKENWVAINFSIGQQDFLRKEVVKDGISYFIRDVLGYYPYITSSWFVKTKEDLYKVLLALHKLPNKGTDIPETDTKDDEETLRSKIIALATDILKVLKADYAGSPTISEYDDSYHIYTPVEVNNFIFSGLSLSGEEIKDYITNIVGYRPLSGDFPPVKSLEDLYKVLVQLKEDTLGAVQLKSSNFVASFVGCFKDERIDTVSKESHDIQFLSNQKRRVKLNFKY